MLPFLKNKEGSVSAPIEHIKFGDGEEEFDLLDAVAEDILTAIEHKDKNMLKSALESFAEHLKAEDEEEDIQQFEPKRK